MSGPTISSPFLIHGTVQHYPWGTTGDRSLVARLVGAQDPRPYAELWFGAHPKGPSTCKWGGRDLSLRELIERFPEEMLGPTVARRYGAELPFLLKVLSVGAPLSIQTHPDRALAAVLHGRDPEHYPDASHKPECGVALTPVTLLFGMRALRSREELLAEVPELAPLIPGVSGENLLSTVFRALFSSAPSTIRAATGVLVERLTSQASLHEADQWALRFATLYPDGDPGVFCSYLMNILHLDPGEAVFIGPNVPHAYLCGDIVECMASSDNVVRAGLTGKFKDISTLLGMLEYRSHPVESVKLLPTARDAGELLYDVPAEEFRLSLLKGHSIHRGGAPSVLVCGAGEVEVRWGEESGSVRLRMGDALFVPACTPEYRCIAAGGEVFRATVGASR